MNKLDIIIACFNPSNYLNNLLKSINTYISNKQSINIIIIDDCSSFSSEYKEIIKYYNKYFNCLYYKTKKNGGPGVARNLGLQYSNSEFITFIDDDDSIVEDILPYCYENYDLIITNYGINNKQNITIGYIDSVQGIIFKKNFLKTQNLIFPQIRNSMEDSIFRCLCLTLTNSILKIYDKSFYYKNIRNDSTYYRLYIKGKDKLNVETFSGLEIIIFNILYFQELKKYSNIDIINFLNILNNIIDWKAIYNTNIQFNFVLDYLVILMYNINYFLKKDILNININFLNPNLKSLIFITFLCSKNQDNILITNFKKLNYNRPLILQNFNQIIDKYFKLNFNNFYDIEAINNLYCNYYYNEWAIGKKINL